MTALRIFPVAGADRLRWIAQPLRDAAELGARHDLVQAFAADEATRGVLQAKSADVLRYFKVFEGVLGCFRGWCVSGCVGCATVF